MTDNEICKDNRFDLIKKYKDKLIECTNIETSKDEMAIIDNVLFRFWQMGWLDKLEDYDHQQAEIERRKNCFNLTYKLDDKQIEEIKNESLKKIELNIEAIESEAIKEFTDKLKNKIIEDTAYGRDITQHTGYYDYQIKIGDISEYIDDLVKEMVGEPELRSEIRLE